MNKFLLEFILITLITLILVLPSALLVDFLSHEAYHVYKNHKYSEEVCLSFNEKGAYTNVNFINYEDIKNYELNGYQEEKQANTFGKIIALLYALLILAILNTLFYLNRI